MQTNQKARDALSEELRVAAAAAAAATSTDGVHSLSTGRYAEAATYGPGEKVSGVVVSPDAVEVHIVARYPLNEPIPKLARDIVERISPHVRGRRVTVVVEDLEMVEDESI